MLPRALAAAAVAAALIAVPAASAKTTWLCRPDNASDPCHKGLTSTVFTPTGERRGTAKAPADRHPEVDCFYVYPTVSEEAKPQADFKITPSLKAVAAYQAARFRQVCRVWAPVYRQITIQGLLSPKTVTPAMERQGYDDVLVAWRDYLAHHNHGRGVILVSHSQGTFVLRELIPREIERKPAQLKRLVSALLIGGNVEVPKGKDVGGDFKRVRACRSDTQTGCVVAYSTFDETPPADSKFGRTKKAGREVLCTNPAALGGGSAKLESFIAAFPFPGILGQEGALESGPLPQVSTPWLSYPGAFTARCSAAGGAHVLNVTPAPGGRDLTPEPDATWGLHLSDMFVAFGNLVDVARSQAAAYLKARQ